MIKNVTKNDKKSMTRTVNENGLKIRGKKSKSVVINLPIELVKEIIKIGNNSNPINIKKSSPENLRKGIYEAIGAWKTLNRDPKKLLFSDINVLHDHIRVSGLENHYRHFEKCCVTDFLVNWVKTGKVNPNILKAPNKDLDDFKEEEEK